MKRAAESLSLSIYINAHTIIARTVYLLCSILAFNYLILSIGSTYTAVRLQVESFPIYRAIVRWKMIKLITRDENFEKNAE